MGNRRRFLYRIGTELRGRGWEARAGNGKTGASTGAGMQEKPHAKSERATRSEERVAKRAERPPRKAAMDSYAPVP